MKVLSTQAKEPSCDFYGKAGMTVLGAMIIVNKRVTSTEVPLHSISKASRDQLPYQAFFIDCIPTSNEQSTATTLAMWEATLHRLRLMFPKLKRLALQGDNGPHFTSPAIVFVLRMLFAKYGFMFIEYIRNEAGDGKTLLDAHFSALTAHINVRLPSLAYACSAAHSCLVVT